MNVPNGKRVLKEIMLLDPVGVTGVSSVRFSRDEKTYAYSFYRNLSTLYLLEGLTIHP